MKHFLVDALLVSLLAMALSAAPAPFPRPARSRPLDRARLVGVWVMQWGDVRCSVTLSAAGDYSCAWPGARYIGSWGVDAKGRLCLTESCRPCDAASWQTYAIRLDARTLRGRVVEGVSGVEVRLEKQQ